MCTVGQLEWHTHTHKLPDVLTDGAAEMAYTLTHTDVQKWDSWNSIHTHTHRCAQRWGSRNGIHTLTHTDLLTDGAALMAYTHSHTHRHVQYYTDGAAGMAYTHSQA